METRPKTAAEIAWDRDQLIECFDEAIDPLTSLADEWRDMDGDCYLSTMMRCLRVIGRIECANRVCQKDQVGDQYDDNTCSPGRYEHMPAKYTTEPTARFVPIRGADVAHCDACGHDVMIAWGKDNRRRCGACGGDV